MLTTFCHEIHLSLTPIVIERASDDQAYCAHPTVGLYGLESYIASEIARSHGGTLGVSSSAEVTLFLLTLPRESE